MKKLWCFTFLKKNLWANLLIQNKKKNKFFLFAEVVAKTITTQTVLKLIGCVGN